MLVLLPVQMLADTGVTVSTGVGLTVMVCVVVPVHPAPLVPVTVNVVVDDGAAVTVAPVVALNPVDGAQL